ncbi:MAG: peptidoglycan DD-metalloendopeptidase family protein, partial [Clostridia bacterium]
NLVAVALSSDDIETALSNYVNEQATFSYGEYTQAEIVNKTEYIKGSYSTDIFTKDIDAAIKNTAFSLKVTVMSLTDLKVAPKTIYVDNSDLLEGKEKTLSEGKDGVREDTYAQTFINGELKDELLLKSIYKIEPQNKIIERGVMLSPKKETASVAIFVAPYDGGISSAYGTRYLLGSNFHGGVDFAAKASGQNCFKAPVVAAGDGIVVGASYSGNFGKLIIIEHSNGIRTYYAHLNDFAVKVGQKVNQGEMIAHIGLTGQTQGPHVHFEVRLPDGKGDYYRVNPKYYIIDYESYLR